MITSIKDNAEIDRFKNFTPEQKLKLSLKLYYSARELKKCGLRMLSPGLTEEVLEKKVTEIFLYART